MRQILINDSFLHFRWKLWPIHCIEQSINAKTLLFTCALALSILGVASAKSYSVVISESAKVGTATLKPGEYEVSVKGDQAVFRGTGQKDITVPVKVEQGSSKFNATSIDSSQKDGTTSINEIDLGGSTTRLEFGQ
jgi:hypothetical protein